MEDEPSHTTRNLRYLKLKVRIYEKSESTYIQSAWILISSIEFQFFSTYLGAYICITIFTRQLCGFNSILGEFSYFSHNIVSDIHVRVNGNEEKICD